MTEQPKIDPFLLVNQLSPQEYKAMVLIAKGFKTADIAINMGCASATVSTYRYRLLKKLRLSTNADIVKFALTAGIIQ